MAIPQEFIAQLRSMCNVADVIGGYVQLKRSGRMWKGLCPFHSEKTPSFTVFPDTESYYCFGCQSGGDVITFIRNIEHLDYVEAVKFLAAKAGLDMPEDGAYDGLADAKRRMREANREAARFFHRQLYTPAGAQALGYLRSRGLTDETITHFGLGWSPDSWDALSKHLVKCGFRPEEIVSANLGMNNRFGNLTDRFRNRVMFPIIDLQGSVIAFGGRTMEKDHGGKKYLNTSDTLIYKKTNNLYGINWAKNAKSDTIVVTEGFMDVIAMQQSGIENVVASQGTAFTAEQARLIARYAKRVILAQDGDEAGQNAIRRSIPIIKATGVDVRVLSIPENLDPDEYIKKYGVDRMKKLLDECASDIDYSIDRIRVRHNLASDDGRLQFLREVCPVLADLSPLEREVYAGRIASDLGIDKAAILSQIDAGQRRRRFEESRTQLKNLEQGISGRDDNVNPERQTRIRAARAEESLITLLFHHPDAAEGIAAKLPPEKMITTFNRRLYSSLLELAKSDQQPSLSLLSQQLSTAEMGAASRILNSSPALQNDISEADGYIAIILEEGARPTTESIADASAEDLKNYLEMLKKKKK